MNPQRLNPNQLRLIVAGLGALLLLVLAWAVFSASNYTRLSSTGELKLTVVPNDSTIQVDSGGKSTNYDLQLAPGSHTITFARRGFDSKTLSFTVQTQQLNTGSVVLQANSQEGLDYLKAHPDQQQAGEGATGDEANKAGVTIAKANPIISKLPYQGADFQIDYGLSQKHPDSQDAVGIYVTTTDAAGRVHALSWIRAQGADPNAMEIIYGGNQ
jgi:hypothetical protein